MSNKTRTSMILTDDVISELRKRNAKNQSESLRAIVRRYAFTVREGMDSLERNLTTKQLNTLADKFANCMFDYPESVLFLDQISTVKLTPEEHNALAAMNIIERIALVDYIEQRRRNAAN